MISFAEKIAELEAEGYANAPARAKQCGRAPHASCRQRLLRHMS